MKVKRIIIFGLLIVLLTCTLFQGVSAENHTTAEEEEDDFLGVSGFGGAILSTAVWTIIGLLLVLVSVGVVDLVTDKMKHNWLNLEEVAGNPTAMAIIAAGLMIAVGIIIHAATVG